MKPERRSDADYRPAAGGPERRGISLGAGVFLLALLLVPGLAGAQLARTLDGRVLAGYLAAISLVTFGLYWHDKRRAVNNGWRTPESTLHLVEMIGGWPAAFLAQRAFRHKISKVSYQVAFWGIVALHEAVALDFLLGWRYAQSLLAMLRG